MSSSNQSPSPLPHADARYWADERYSYQVGDRDWQKSPTPWNAAGQYRDYRNAGSPSAVYGSTFESIDSDAAHRGNTEYGRDLSTDSYDGSNSNTGPNHFNHHRNGLSTVNSSNSPNNTANNRIIPKSVENNGAIGRTPGDETSSANHLESLKSSLEVGGRIDISPSSNHLDSSR